MFFVLTIANLVHDIVGGLILVGKILSGNKTSALRPLFLALTFNLKSENLMTCPSVFFLPFGSIYLLQLKKILHTS